MKQLLFFLFIFSLNTFSQTINLGNFFNIQNTQIDDKKNELYVFYKDSISVIDLINFKKISTLKLINPEQISLTNPSVFVDSKIYFIENLGGKVYRMDGNKIVRVDNSFTHKMQINSTIFIFNKTIYKYGGYGFWSERNFFTFFDKENMEWNIVSPIGSHILPNGSQQSTIVINNNDFYIFGGLTLDKFDPLKYQENNEVWKFNIINKSWSKIGTSKIDFDLDNFNVLCSYNNKIIYTTVNDFISVIDVVNNKLKTYRKTSFQSKMVLESFYKNGIFYCFRWDNSKENEIQLAKRNEDEFFGKLISVEKFYHNNENTYYGLGIILLFMILIISYFKFRKWNQKRNRIIVENENLVFKRTILNFDDKAIQIVNLLLKSDKEIISKDIMEIVENPNLNYGHNTRIMNRFIEEINFKLKSTLGLDKKIITFKKSNLDKRIKVYSMDKSYFFIK